MEVEAFQRRITINCDSISHIHNFFCFVFKLQLKKLLRKLSPFIFLFEVRFYRMALDMPWVDLILSKPRVAVATHRDQYMFFLCK